MVGRCVGYLLVYFCSRWYLCCCWLVCVFICYRVGDNFSVFIIIVAVEVVHESWSKSS
ncbi:putative membrane protein [Candidatus Ichthyocystis hellenicum]|uniref:Putative membrane protein n=1 Tax=Candidatus Ichthyocystis hellenicum TaxID=1561003 RepID=A0A0S4M3Q7_9BURK|nr:putative membrane protein [Candidatus Ichthyocystis hellenicum]